MSFSLSIEVMGLAGIEQAVALASGRRLGRHRAGWLLDRDQARAEATPRKPGPNFQPKAKRVVQLFMSGAASQVDTFDFKPELIKRHGAKFDPGGRVELFQSAPGACMQSPWKWKQHGQCGKFISDLLPNLATCADDICFIHSWWRNRTCTAPPRSCRTPDSCCLVFRAWEPGCVWAGQRQRKPACLCRAARRARLSAQRPG